MSDTINFYSLMPELVEQMPIEKAKISNFKWYKNLVDDYLKRKPPVHTAKCPGIISIANEGWIHRAYQDFEIETNGDGETFSWKCDVDQSKSTHGHLISNYVSQHSKQQLFDFGTFKRDTLKTIVKIQSPWVVKIPDGYSLLSMPVPYSDNNEFTAAIGTLKDLSFLNVQLFWHCLNEKVVVKKGTPLCQYILVKDHSVQSSIEPVSDDIVLKIVEMLLESDKKHLFN